MGQSVLLTGITGFIAKRIALDLLNAGYTVRGSLRSESRADEVRDAVRPHLKDPSALDRLSFVSLDLTSDAGWPEAMEGVEAVLHTASPFPLEQPKNEDDLIRPAVDGTLRAMRAAQAAGITRVVLTSSMAAVMLKDLPQGGSVNEDDWTDVNSRFVTAYDKSKTLAERAAWDFVKNHPEMQLTTINPGLVAGTPLDRQFGTSLELVERCFSGKDPAVPNFGLPAVDLNDVSAMHVAALAKPATIGNRYCASAGWVMLPEVATWLASAYPERKVTTRIAPKLLLQVLSLFDKSVKSVLPNLNRRLTVDTSRAEYDLGIAFRPAKDAILASAAFLAKG